MPTSNLSLFAICVLIWGSTWLAITFQLGPVAPELSVGYRFVLAAVVLMGVCAVRKQSIALTRAQHIDVLFMGAAMFCVSYIFVYHAEIYIISGMVAVGYSASPMVNMLNARLFFGTPISSRVTVASLLGIAGIVCVFWHEIAHLGESKSMALGALFTALAVLFSSFGNMVAMRTQQRGVGTWPSMAWGMLYGGILSIIVALAIGRPLTFAWTSQYLLSMLYLAVLGSIVTFAAYLTLLKRIGPARSAYVGVMTPIVALVVSVFFEKFTWGWLTTLGVALSIAGNILVLQKPASKSP